MQRRLRSKLLEGLDADLAALLLVSFGLFDGGGRELVERHSPPGYAQRLARRAEAMLAMDARKRIRYAVSELKAMLSSEAELCWSADADRKGSVFDKRLLRPGRVDQWLALELFRLNGNNKEKKLG